MKNIKKCLSLVLSFAIVMLTALPVFATEKEYRKGDIIEFGVYPQDLVEDAVILAKLNSEDKTWQNLPFQERVFNEDSSIVQIATKVEYQYCDITADGEKYRAVKTIEDGSVNYFKFTPIEWIVLNPETGFVISVDTLDVKPFYNKVELTGMHIDAAGENLDKDPLDYTESDLRTWLNNDFYNTAFSDIQKKSVKLTTINNYRYGNDFSQLGDGGVFFVNHGYDRIYEYEWYEDTEDNVFLLSVREYFEYGFNEAHIPEVGLSVDVNSLSYSTASDYAHHIRIWSGNEFYAYCTAWWLRSAGGNEYTICYYYPWDGMMVWYGMASGFSADDEIGIRPAMCIDLENFDKTYIIGDVDGDGGISSSDARIALRAAVGLEEVTPDMIATVDVDKDKSITASDARLILRASVGLEKLS